VSSRFVTASAALSNDVSARIIDARRQVPATRCVLTAVTGIDGSGKGYVTTRVSEALHAKGLRVAAINIDGWLNLPRVRFNSAAPAEHFYRHAIRFDDLFAQLVLPLRDRRSLRLDADYAEETATEYRRHLYDFKNVDVIVLEGIYLLKREFQARYDLSFWIDCRFETALTRALARRQEGLSAEETIRAYRTIYFPAQELHFIRDDPRAAATAIVNNDPSILRETERRERS
jgi:uridine kinase